MSSKSKYGREAVIVGRIDPATLAAREARAVKVARDLRLAPLRAPLTFRPFARIKFAAQHYLKYRPKD